MQAHPIFTKEAECQDCYRCVRNCPVKAIKVERAQAAIIPDRCVLCGECVEACPSRAKQIRDDLGRAKHLIATRGAGVYVSLAPSYVSEFPGMPESALIESLLRLGFAGVSETALGAQQVSLQLAERMHELSASQKLFLSSACPAAVDYLVKYLPEKARHILQVLSPAQAHGKFLRSHFGNDIGVVFIGPCIAKKSESDRRPDLIDVALTFEDLRRWFEREGISLEQMIASPASAPRFVPERANEGAVYPLEGGMLTTLRVHQEALGGWDGLHLTVSGLPRIANELAAIDPARLPKPAFMELLACENGCINGPCTSGSGSRVLDALAVAERGRIEPERVTAKRRIDTSAELLAGAVFPLRGFTDEQLREALLRVGKADADDELNCGSCGYDNCREFGIALLTGRAEPPMCHTYMRSLAQRKANALIRFIPAGVVIVDRDLRIIESNLEFARLLDEDTLTVYEACPGLAGILLEKTVPFADLFRIVLQTGKDLHRQAFRTMNRLFEVSVFTIEPGKVVGGVLQDVTQTELHRDLIARRAQEVIRKNLVTVQEIACRLGENMAETELLLRSLADGFASPRLRCPGGNGTGDSDG